MPAFVTDQFRILNTNNFVDSISKETDYYYIFFGLANPGISGFRRNDKWDSKLSNKNDMFTFYSLGTTFNLSKN